MERWKNPTTGTTMWVHDSSSCDPDRPCVVHRRTQHALSDRRLLWRSDRGIFERICVHGVGHPDPDQFEYWRRTGRSYEAVHGCDGCCRPG